MFETLALRRSGADKIVWIQAEMPQYVPTTLPTLNNALGNKLPGNAQGVRIYVEEMSLPPVPLPSEENGAVNCHKRRGMRSTCGPATNPA